MDFPQMTQNIQEMRSQIQLRFKTLLTITSNSINFVSQCLPGKLYRETNLHRIFTHYLFVDGSWKARSRESFNKKSIFMLHLV